MKACSLGGTEYVHAFNPLKHWGTTPTDFAPFGAVTDVPAPSAFQRGRRHCCLITEDLRAIHQRVSLLTA